MATKKDDEEIYYNNKITIIQEARIFNESPVNPRKCRTLLTRIVYLLYTGETFATHEATSLFFGTTKLFQHKDPALRQAVYLAIKELSSAAEDVIMVTSSIMKDMQGNMDLIYRPNAIRALCRIIDPSMLQGVERFFKAAIVDKNTAISSAALVSSYHFFPVSKEVIKRWANEVQESVQVKPAQSPFIGSVGGPLNLSSAGGYLGFGSSAPAPPSNPTIPSTSNITHVQKQMFDLLEGWLRHKSDMVNYEAARAICEMRNVTPQQLTRAVAQLQLFLSSPKPTLKFAAMRTLSTLALSHPSSVASCNLDMENLISDSNRSIATYAITTLLKTGNEASVDRLMKTITGFMSEISDEFKVIVVDAIRSLCLKFPNKQTLMLTFLSSVLRDEGGYDFKRSVVEAIFDMIRFIKESKEAALAHLCEFIEDCEFTKLSVRVLHLLGIEGPKAPNPTKYIRYIYNRVVLENAIVRAAAVTSLAKFGVCGVDPTIKRSVTVLLNRCLDDVDDEVRDRAALYLRIMKEEELAESFVKEDSVYSLATLESKLVAYVNDPAAQEVDFDASSVPKISRAQAQQESARPTTLESITASVVSQPKASAPAKAAPSAQETQSAYASQLAAEVDPSSGLPEDTGYDDEYQLEEVELSAGGDYIVPTYCSFESEWEKLDGAANAEEEFSLSSMASIKAACESLIEVLNMEALAGSDNPTSTAVHTLLLSGLVAGGGGKVLARCQMAFTASSGVSLRMSVRAEKEEVSQLLISAIG
ncbi:coatomer subunit gamma [Serendipita sp. 405]|nr:coatomer subunit gamma [Serendipita sp. 397]KAG8869343.1 coatomer subunit gamma [Serendipita sp. 405]